MSTRILFGLWGCICVLVAPTICLTQNEDGPIPFIHSPYESDSEQQPSPSCVVDPCSCGWCLENPTQPNEFMWQNLGRGLYGENSDGFILHGDDKMESPVCRIDPCSCGWCTEDRNSVLQFPGIPAADIEPSPFQSQVNFCEDDPCSCGFCSPDSRFEQFDFSRNTSENFAEELSLIDRGSIFLGQTLVSNESFCPEQQIRPWAVSREQYFDRNAMLRCTDAVLALNEFQDEQKQRAESILGIPKANLPDLVLPEDLSNGELDIPTFERARKIFSDYASYCLRGFDDLADEGGSLDRSTSNVLNFGSARGATQALKNSIGLLEPVDTGASLCSGALVSLNSKPTLIAAAHCLNSGAQLSEGELLIESVFSRLKFTTFAGDTFYFSVSDELVGMRYDAARGDIFAVELEHELDLSLIEVVSIPIAAWEPMMIIGRNTYLENLSLLDKLEGIDLIRASIAVEFGSDCRARVSSQGAMHYICQTADGTSGAPIVVWREGWYQLAGLHIGTFTRAPLPLSCSGGVGRGGVNRGIAIREP